MLNEVNQIHKFISSSGSGTVINSGSDFLTSYGSGSTRQKVTVPVPQHWSPDMHIIETERSVGQVNLFIIENITYISGPPEPVFLNVYGARQPM